ncbi:MAG: HAD hydrolase-like protein, partial [Bacilli bacterium]|nr:HAD hydrolase-like protein [Bacilli bacterium]
VLKYLQASGYKTAVATLKVESGALAILKAHDMDKYFDLIYGVDVNNTYSKADLVQKAMTILNIPPNKTILVGDTVYDLQGADIAKVDFLAVTYGFGFSLQNLDLLNNKALIAHHPQDIIKKLESVVS